MTCSAESILDDNDVLNRIDQGGMGRMIRSFPMLVRDAVEISRSISLPRSYNDASEIVVCGMGGSAIGGDLLRDLSQASSGLNISVIRDYSLPGYVGDRSIVVAVSYSGNTEETLEAFRQAYERKVRIVGVASGGLIEKACVALKLPFVRVPQGLQPRAALPLLFIPLLKVAGAVGVQLVDEEELEYACRLLEEYSSKLVPEVPFSSNLAKQIAARLQGRLPIIYSLGHLRSVALRYKDQINENAKMRAMCDQFPELNHNEIEAWERADLKELLHVILIDSRFKNPYLAEGINGPVSKIRETGVEVSVIQPPGETMLSEMLAAILFGDWVSYYLAILRGVDPTSVSLISELKKKSEEKVKYSKVFEDWLRRVSKNLC
ncbi:MAG: bifunctional phosphoglucose/phosphomannose isomerase [Thermoproteota archaeon]